jgi:hypothetical protein
METSGPNQHLGFGIAPQAGRETREGPRISLVLSAEPLTKLPLFKQRNNLIQQDAENCQQKILPVPGSNARLPPKSKASRHQANHAKLAGSGLRLRRVEQSNGSLIRTTPVCPATLPHPY